MPDLFDPEVSAKELARRGMQQAADHADRVHPEPRWTELAYGFFLRFAQHNHTFMTEDARVWAYQHGLPHPPAPQAWGAVTTRALKEKVVTHHSMRKTRVKPAHATKRDVWQSLIVGGVQVVS